MFPSVLEYLLKIIYLKKHLGAFTNIKDYIWYKYYMDNLQTGMTSEASEWQIRKKQLEDNWMLLKKYQRSQDLLKGLYNNIHAVR